MDQARAEPQAAQEAVQAPDRGLGTTPPQQAHLATSEAVSGFHYQATMVVAVEAIWVAEALRARVAGSGPLELPWSVGERSRIWRLYCRCRVALELPPVDPTSQLDAPCASLHLLQRLVPHALSPPSALPPELIDQEKGRLDQPTLNAELVHGVLQQLVVPALSRGDLILQQEESEHG